VNVYLKNRQHGLKNLIESSAATPDDYVEEHWESMKHLIVLEAK
jgi:hypothetical protein